MEDFRYKCKKCGSTNTIAADWFRDTQEKKIHACSNCTNKVQLNASKIRADFYNNFKTATELVFGNKKIQLDDLYLKISVGDDLKKLQKLDHPTIIIGRGNELKSETILDENKTEIQRITVPDRFVSSRHCQLNFNPKNNKVTIQDLGSLNKTFLDSNEVIPGEILILKIGNQVKIGTTLLEIC